MTLLHLGKQNECSVQLLFAIREFVYNKQGKVLGSNQNYYIVWLAYFSKPTYGSTKRRCKLCAIKSIKLKR